MFCGGFEKGFSVASRGGGGFENLSHRRGTQTRLRWLREPQPPKRDSATERDSTTGKKNLNHRKRGTQRRLRWLRGPQPPKRDSATEGDSATGEKDLSDRRGTQTRLRWLRGPQPPKKKPQPPKETQPLGKRI